MHRDSSKQADQAIDRGIEKRVDQAGAEESLSEALSGLEQIIEHRQAGPAEATQADVDAPQAVQTDPQYTIPLLHDVVVPGNDEAPGEGEVEALESSVEEAEACHKLSERLANEIEVIVQARVETAVQEAAEDIREQVRNHLEIMLPEIIEELNALGRRQGG